MKKWRISRKLKTQIASHGEMTDPRRIAQTLEHIHDKNDVAG